MIPLRNTLIIFSIAVICSACAHSITIPPDINNLTRDEKNPKIEKAVGYYISEKNRTLKVTTPAGGGDSVEYAPYKDLEPGFYKVLSNVFSSVYVVKDTEDQSFLQSKNITWVFTPVITTNSSSRNHFFWPPTDFTVTIDCKAVDSTDQKMVWETTIQEDGDLIAVKLILRDRGLAGKSAAANALKEFQNQLQDAAVFHQ